MAKYLANSDDITIEEVTGTDSIKFNTKYSMDSLKNGIDNMCVNAESTSTTNAYSTYYVNECNTYSENETFTGKYWIDGKKIYRKVFTGTKNNGNTLISSVDTLISCQGTGKSSTNYRQLPYYEYYNNSSYSINVYQTGSDVKIQVSLGSSTSTEINAAIEYTKVS